MIIARAAGNTSARRRASTLDGVSLCRPRWWGLVAGAGQLPVRAAGSGGGRSLPRLANVHHGSGLAAPATAAPRAGLRASASAGRGRGAGARRHPLLSRQLLEHGPRQVHGLRVVPGATAQRLLPGLRCGTSCPLPAALAHPGGRPEPGPRAGAAFWLPGVETVSSEREVYYPHRGDRRRGLPGPGADPVKSSAPSQPGCVTWPAFIHSFWSQPQRPRGHA